MDPNTTADQLHKSMAEFGIVATLFVILILFLLFAAWKFGNRLAKSAEDKNIRIAAATERMANAAENQAKSVEGINGSITSVNAHLEKQRKAILMALAAIRENDVEIRHKLIDEAAREMAL